jgi:hypothetical protein
MKAVLAYIAVLACCMTAIIFMIKNLPQPEFKVINCGIAEISPDFTNEMKEACRRARMKNDFTR